MSLALDLSWAFLILLFTFDGIITSLPISLGGVGLREGVAVYCLSKMNLPTSVGISFGFIFFLIILINALPGGILYLLMKPKGNGSAKSGIITERFSRDQ